MALMCMLIGDRHHPRLDMNRVLRMALLHDLPEVLTGDLTPGQGGNAQEKAQREMNALRDLLGAHPNFAEYAALLDDYIHAGSEEAKFVKQVDKLERLYQASDYEHTTRVMLDSFFKSGPGLITSEHLRAWVDQLLAQRQPAPQQADQLRQIWLYEKRNQVLSLDEVKEMSTAFYGGPDRLSLYGMTPTQWYRRGVRILGRTAVECSIDGESAIMAREVAAFAQRFFPLEPPIVVDPFAGSANLLFHIGQALGASESVGWENDPLVHGMTERNLQTIGARCRLALGDGVLAAASHAPLRSSPQPLLFLISPPWGGGLSSEHGLNLAATEPSVFSVLSTLEAGLPGRRLYFAVQIHRHTVASSLATLQQRYAHCVLPDAAPPTGRRDVALAFCTNESPVLSQDTM